MYTTQQIVFKVGDERYGLDVQWVNGIESLPNIVTVPNAPECIRGLINMRGQVLPVFSFRSLFGMPIIDRTEETKIIITSCHGTELAFEVDSVLEIAEFSETEIVEAPPIIKGASTAYVDKIVCRDTKLTILINRDGIMDDEAAAEIGTLKNQ